MNFNGSSSRPKSQDLSLPIAVELMGILESLCKNPIAADFLQPVTKLFPEVKEDYERVIKRPMDLGTIVHNLQSGKYGKADRLHRHVQRVFENCKKFNLLNRVFYSRAQHLSDYFESMWADTSLVAAPIRKRHRIQCHQKAKLLLLRGKDLLKCIAAIENCSMNVPNRVKQFLNQARAVKQVVYGELLQQVFIVFEVDPSLELEVAYDQLSPASEGGDQSQEMFACWTRIEEVFLSAAHRIFERSTRGNELSCIWAAPRRCVWAKTRQKESFWPACVLVDNSSTEHEIKTNMSRMPPDILEVLSKHKTKAQSPVLVEFFGTNEFAWIREDFTSDFNAKSDVKFSGHNASKERWEAAVYDLELAKAELESLHLGKEDELSDLLSLLNFNVDAVKFCRGMLDADSDSSDEEVKKQKELRLQINGREKLPPAQMIPKTKKAFEFKHSSSRKLNITSKITQFIQGIVDEDPAFYDCYGLERLQGKKRKVNHFPHISARKLKLINRINKFIQMAKDEDPHFFDVYELPRIFNSKKKRPRSFGSLEENSEISVELEELRREVRRATQKAKAEWKLEEHGEANRPSISLAQWNAYQILHRGRQVQFAEAVRFYSSLNTEMHSQTPIRSLKYPAKMESPNATGEPEADEDLVGCPEGLDSVESCLVRKEYLKKCLDLISSDVNCLEDLYGTLKGVIKHQKQNFKPMQEQAHRVNHSSPKPIHEPQKAQVFLASKISATGKEYIPSNYRGVSFQGNKWLARICLQGKIVTIGRYLDEETAARAYDKKAKEMFGLKAVTNFSDEDADYPTWL